MHHLFVSRAGDSLVNVTQNRNTYRLLANFDGTNVILLQIDAGSVVWLTPDPERPVYLEYYTLLTGELTLHSDEGEAQTLCAGDSFYTTGLDHDISITPKTDVRLLCFTSKPVFDDFTGVSHGYLEVIVGSYGEVFYHIVVTSCLTHTRLHEIKQFIGQVDGSVGTETYFESIESSPFTETESNDR